MEEESLESRTLEAFNIPDSISDDLLLLYFESTRSGGGNVASLERKDGKATVVFEHSRNAAKVLSKGSHVLSGATVGVRRKAPSDPQRFLLCGLHPHTLIELVELFVENIFGIEPEEYSLLPVLEKSLVIIQFHQRPSEDFQTMSAKVVKRHLDGATLRLQRLERTDSVLVENLSASINEDMLTLYFEGDRSGGGEVNSVQMLTESLARVSFKDFEAVERVLERRHKLGGSSLTVKPYFSFLVPVVNSPPTVSAINGASSSVPMEIDQPMDFAMTALSPVTSNVQFPPEKIPVRHASASPILSKHSLNHKAQDEVAGGEETEIMDSETVATPLAMEDLAVAVATSPKPNVPVSCSIAVTDPVKLSLLEMSGHVLELQTIHAGFAVNINPDGVAMSGPEEQGLSQLKTSVLKFLGGIAQTTLPLELEKIEFLAREDIKAKLSQTLKDMGLLFAYTVVDGSICVTSVSLEMADKVCKSIKSQICKFDIAVQPHCESNLYCPEWSILLQSLSFCSAGLTDGGTKITVVTLKGMEEDAQFKIIQYLSTPIQREVVISMEPGKLKYLQNHCGQLLADMTMVTLFPLETGDGLIITGDAGACQMTEEVLRGVVDAICTRTITIRQSGVARFLVEQEGVGILEMLQSKFQVYISMEKVHWEPLEDEDIFKAGWKIMSQQNIVRDGHTSNSGSTTASSKADQSMENIRIKEAKQLLSAIQPLPSNMKANESSQGALEEDIYTAEEGASFNDGTTSEADDATQDDQHLEAGPLRLENDDAELDLAKQLSLESMDSSNLDEIAQMSLAIQMSMECTGKFTSADDMDGDDELQRVLARSKMEVSSASACASAANPIHEDVELKQAMVESLQDAIRAANVAEIFVFANYSHDLIRTDIALGKKVDMRQCEEKVENRNLKYCTTYHQRCLDIIRRKHAVDIRVEGTTAIISGFKDYVAEAVPTVKDFARQMGNVTSDAEILKTVQWEYHTQGTTAPYPPEATVYLENAWKMKHRRVDILIDHQPHLVDFEKMEEIHVASQKSVAIARRLLNTGELDVIVIPDEELSLLSSLPDVELVDEDSDECQDVVKEFYDTIQEYHNKIKIIRVEKLKNSLLHNQYKLKKASMMQLATDQQVERTLFHGTSEISVKDICKDGFNRSFCGKNATVYGQGSYFAVNSSLSVSDTYSPPNSDGHKFIFMVKVLTGDYTVGKHEMRTAPKKENSDMRYDSVADQMNSPKLFVIFNDTQAYPEYLITCQKIYR